MKNIFFKSLIIICLMMFFICPGGSAETFDDTDINRVVCIRNEQECTYLVVDEIVDKNTLRCHVYTKKRKVKVATARVEKTIFFDTTPIHMISQYAIYYRVYYRANPSQKKVKHAMNLWNLCGDTSPRLETLSIFDSEMRKARNKLSSTHQQLRNVSDADDRTDAYLQVLDECNMQTVISENLNCNDFALLIAMYYDFYLFMSQMERLDPEREKGVLYRQARGMRMELEKELCQAFLQHFHDQAERRQRFTKIFPNIRGARWQKPMPRSSIALLECFSECMQSYFKLNKLTPFSSPEDWGSAALDSLMLIGGSQCAESLEKKFDNTVSELEQNP